jgi:hypothetical protein
MTVGARAARASDDALPALESEVAAAMRGLSESPAAGSNDVSRALAERLARGEEGTSVAQWRTAPESEIATSDARLLLAIGATEVKTVSFQDAAAGATQGRAEAPRARERML